MAKKTEESKLPASLEEFVKNTGLELAQLESIGASSISFGYANFVRAAEIDRLELLELNKSNLKPSSLMVLGQQFIVFGYILLCIVSSRRLEEREFVLSTLNKEANLTPFIRLKYAYLGSLYFNTLRLNAFIELDKNDPTGELIP